MSLFFFTVTYIIACANIKPFHRECQKDAIKRGWHPLVVELTRGTQYFTLYGQLWLIIAMFTDFHPYKVIARFMGLWVFGLYSAIVSYDPTLLAWDDPVLVRQVTGVLPPTNKYVVVWCGLFFQHRIVPLWYILVEPIRPMLIEGILAFVAGYLFILWSEFTWYVQGRPAYPIQEKLGEHYGAAKHGILWLMAITIIISCTDEPLALFRTP
jgi:hypothetical protein